MTTLQPNRSIRGGEIPLEYAAVPAEQTVAGAPRTGVAELGRLGDLEVGIWEMTEGTMTDVETDEVFVVLSGRATVEFDDGTEPLDLRACDVVRLAAGARTTWTVTERLRKVYLA